MADVDATRLLERNAEHVRSLPPDHFEAVQDGQEPTLVSVCCSDSRVSQEGMFGVTDPGWLFTPSNIGNQVWDRVIVDGQTRTVVDGSLLYPIEHTGTRIVAVVGHTRCGAVTAAYDQMTDGGTEPAGIQKLVDMLAPVVGTAIEEGIVQTDTERARIIDELVEYNVDRQVAYLRESEEIPAETTVYGFVYDFHGRYDGAMGRLYLVNADGDRDPERLRERVGDTVDEHVARLIEY